MSQEANKLDQLGPAMARAFADIDNVVKNADNPFFKSTYADLSAVLNAVRPVYAKHGLAVLQFPGPMLDGNISLTTIVMHLSGQHLLFTGQVPLTKQTDKKTGESYFTAQSAGSALTYLRRYALAALAGIAQVDDDGNEASARSDSSDEPSDLSAKIAEALAAKNFELLKTYREAASKNSKHAAEYLAARNQLKETKE